MHNTKTAGRWLATIPALWSLWAAAAAADVPAGATGELLRPLLWRPATAGLRGAGAAALAVEPRGGRLAIGDAQGVRIGLPGQPFRRLLHRGPVLDLAFLSDGALLAATEGGLYRIDPGIARGAGPAIAPGPGAAARAVRRIAAVPGVTAVATDDGIFVSRDTQHWQRLSGALPGGAASVVALRRRGEVVTCWAAIRGTLWRVDLQPQAGGLTASASARVTIPFAARDGGAVDIAAGLSEVGLVVVFPKMLALRRADSGSDRWEIVRPELPPGARALRLGRGAGRYWLATDAGLLEAPRLTGPWRRTSPPAGASAVAAAASGGDAVFVAASAGVLEGSAPPPPDAAESRVASSPAPVADPPVEWVHRAALRYLGLTRSHMEALRRGAQRRGWLPIVIVRGGAGWDRSQNTEHDQAFLSGATRYLTDHERDRDAAVDVSLSLSWDLSDIAYEPESVDVSRETREVIELRDNVLDEITQLYYERRRVLSSLAAEPAPPGGEQQRLRLRADELAAGIDGWTGGWFSRQVARSPLDTRSHRN
jgi:hypothetical protein